MFPEASTLTTLPRPVPSEPARTLTVLPGWKPVPPAVTVDPGEAVHGFKEGLGTPAPPLGVAVNVAVAEGPRTASSSARPMSPPAQTMARRPGRLVSKRGRRA
jgi:hypothetical protein